MMKFDHATILRAMSGLLRAALPPIALLIAAAPEARAAERNCAVSAVEGTSATLWRFGAERPLSPGALPAGESTIRTGDATRVEIACDDGTVVTIGAGTRVALESLAGAGPSKNVLIQIIEGVVGAVAPSRSWSGFELRSPLAIAAIRSTEWLMEHDPEKGSAVFVREGRVRVSAPAGPAYATLGPGEGLDVSSDGAGAVKTWGAARVEAVGARLGFGWR